MRVDRHRHVDRAVADDLLHHVRRGPFGEKQAHAGVPHVVEPRGRLAEHLADDVPAAAEVVGLDRRANAVCQLMGDVFSIAGLTSKGSRRRLRRRNGLRAALRAVLGRPLGPLNVLALRARVTVRTV